MQVYIQNHQVKPKKEKELKREEKGLQKEKSVKRSTQKGVNIFS